MWVFESLIFLVLSSDNLSLDSKSGYVTCCLILGLNSTYLNDMSELTNFLSVRDESSILPESCLHLCSVLAPASLVSEYPGIVLLGMLPPYD